MDDSGVVADKRQAKSIEISEPLDGWFESWRSQGLWLTEIDILTRRLIITRAVVFRGHG